jgi:DNA-binding LacI/PurR family transcriptional regulator
MIILGHAPNILLEQLNRAQIPFVSVEAEKGCSQANIIMPDHYSAGYLPTKYLIDLGHRRIAYAGSPYEFFSIRQQILGYRDALADAEVVGDENLIIRTSIECYANLEVGQAVAKRILSMEKKPSAVIFGGELDAVDGLRFFQSNGFVVPTDISIVASGSSAMSICKSTNPPLTNICCISDEILGRLAVRRLIEIVNDSSEPTCKIVLPVKLVVGGSTAAPML